MWRRGSGPKPSPTWSRRRRPSSGSSSLNGMAWPTALLAEAHRLAARAEPALALARRGLEITQAAQYWYGAAHAHRVLGRIASDAGEWPEAGANLAEALRIFDSIGARFEAARTRLELASLADARGDGATATSHLREANQLLETLEAPGYVERANRLAVQLNLPVA